MKNFTVYILYTLKRIAPLLLLFLSLFMFFAQKGGLNYLQKSIVFICGLIFVLFFFKHQVKTAVNFLFLYTLLYFFIKLGEIQIWRDLKEDIVSRLLVNTPADIGYFQNSLLFGGSELISNYIYLLFLGNGITHIISVSGFNMNIIYRIVSYMTSWLRYRLIKYILIQIILLIYIFIIGIDNIPAFRAFLMISYSIWAKYFGRVNYFSLSVLMSLLVLLLVDINYLYSLSFYLTFLCTIALITFGKNPNGLFFDVRISLILLLFTSPVIVYFIGSINLNGVISNIFILPFIELITYLTLLKLFFSNLIGGFMAYISDFIIRLIFYINIFISDHINFQLDVSNFRVQYLLISIVTIFLIVLIKDYLKWNKWQKY